MQFDHTKGSINQTAIGASDFFDWPFLSLLNLFTLVSSSLIKLVIKLMVLWNDTSLFLLKSQLIQ